MDFHPYHGRSGWLKELERLITDLRRDNVPPGRISVLLLKIPRGDEQKHLQRMDLHRLSEDEVPQLTDIETDWHRGVAYVGMSRARTRLHVLIHEDCDGKRREREEEWEARGESDVEMVL